METKRTDQRTLYQTPHLEQQANYISITGLSLPIGTTAFEDPLLEYNDFLGGEQQ